MGNNKSYRLIERGERIGMGEMVKLNETHSQLPKTEI